MYANLHGKSHFSCGQAIGKSSEIIKTAKELGLAGVAMTDFCSLGGVFNFIQEGKKQDFPVVVGAEINYWLTSTEYYKIVLLVKEQAGYHNLCKLITSAYRWEYKIGTPACSLPDLEDFSQGLLCLTGDIDGAIAKDYLTLDSDTAYKKARSRVSDLKRIFKDDLYLELTLSNEMYQWDSKEKDYVKRYEVNPQHTANVHAIAMAERMGLKTIITSNNCVPKESDKSYLDVVIRNTPRGKEGYYVRQANHIFSGEELESRGKLFGIGLKHIQQAMGNSIEALNKCREVDFNFNSQVVNYPIIDHPLHKDGMGKEDLVWEIIKHYGRLKEDSAYQERIAYELDTIIRNGKINLIDYFLVLEDLCRWCRNNGIIVGPGRGSGAGSLLNFCLKITHLDPIKNGLLFERFISEARILKGTYPDIDLDFSDQARVKQYLYERYGYDRVRPISVFQTMRLKTAIKDAFKLHYPDVDYNTVNTITTSLGRKEELETEVEYFERLVQEDETFKNSIYSVYSKIGDAVEHLIGYNRQTGIHPCGMAITQGLLEEIVPIRKVRGAECLDYSLDACETVGVIKYDILSLSTLRYIQTCVNLIKERHGIDVDIYDIPTDDKDVYHQFNKGNTESVFQFNSDVAKGILTRIISESIEDLSLTTSAGRPGPMQNQQHIEFIERKIGAKETNPPHPALKETLEETYGIMMYQESVMQASVILGGFSLSEADDIRKAMGKKKKHLLKPYKERFIAHAQEKYDDIDEHRAGEIWHLMETFAGYGFNKSHSMAYAYIGYLCMYLKHHYPLEWWFGCLTNTVDKPEKFREYYQAAEGFTKLPSINESTNEFFIKDDKIVLPFSVIKKVGEKANAEISAHRPYTDLKDFYDKVNKRVINKTVFTQLIFSGAFSDFEIDKYKLLNDYFITLRGGKNLPEEFEHINREKLVELEKNSLDFMELDYYEVYQEVFNEDSILPLNLLDKAKTKTSVVVGGKVTKLTKGKTKKGDVYATAIIQNNECEVKVRLWSEEYRMYADKTKEGNVLKIKGKVDRWNNKSQVVATHVFTLEDCLAIIHRRNNL